MSRSGAYRGPKLPSILLDQVQDGRVSKGRNQPTRKDRRKEERASKRSVRSQPRPSRPNAAYNVERTASQVTSRPPPKDVKPGKSILKQMPESQPEEVEGESEDDDVDEDDGESEVEYAPRAPVVSKAIKSRLQDDDDEIAALERKLGMNKKKSKKTGDDELDWLVYGSDSDTGGISAKRKRPEDDDWLRDKRRKATGAGEAESDDDDLDMEVNDDEHGLDDLDNPFSEDELSGNDAFEGFDSDDDEQYVEPKQQKPDQRKKPRENPYVAPTSDQANAPAKYVPPSMRAAPSSDDEALKQLRRQIQGLLNRLSDANMLSILQSVQDVYTKNARQHVTSTLIDLLKDRISDPAVLNDTFLILHAGFSAALYRVIGTDFGAQLLESLVQAFDNFHGRQNLSSENTTLSEGKQTLNILAFLTDFYVMQAISCDIIFDYMRMLLDKDNFSEANTELLLRMIRIAGTQLRQDDPTSLKDVVVLLQKTTSALGESNVSVRTKFMIETIHDLKNNRMKTGVVASALSAEHMQRMKRSLGSVKSAKTTEPLRINLSDIRDSDKKGKWWLIGASWRDPAKMVSKASAEVAPASNSEDVDEGAESDSSDVDLDKLARSQGMNTDIRRAIFIAVTGAVDYQHAHMRILKLNLKNKQQIEIPRVLMHCVGAEPVYNHFYSLVATKFCGDHKLRKAYQFGLLDLFRRMGELEQDDAPEDDGQDLDVRKLNNFAKFYATLVAEGLLRITILKALDFASLQPKTKLFVDILLSMMFVLLRKKAHKQGFEKAVKETYSHAHAVPDMVTGLKYYLTRVLPRSDFIESKKERKVLASGCDFALESLAEVPARRVLQRESSDEE